MAQQKDSREEMIQEFLADELQNERTEAPQEDAPVLALPSADGEDDVDTDMQIDDSVLLAWEGPEFQVYARDKQWYVAASIVLLLIVAYAVIVNSPIMAITFILIGVVGYIYLQKEPRTLVFAVTDDGVMIGTEFFPFEEIESFWIFYEPPHTYLLSLTMRNRMLPHVHIPLHQVDPEDVRGAMRMHAPEVRQEMSVVDTIERLMHM